jgi:hypothetical protein
MELAFSMGYTDVLMQQTFGMFSQWLFPAGNLPFFCRELTER